MAGSLVRTGRDCTDRSRLLGSSRDDCRVRRSLAVLLLATPVALSAQSGVVAVLVIDDATDAPLPGVSVGVVGQRAEGVTDENGRFVYVAPRGGTAAFLVRRLGYRPGSFTASVVPGDTTRISFIMSSVPRTLASVDVRDSAPPVSPALRDFERRRRINTGGATFITRDDIERRSASLVTDLLRRSSALTIKDSSGVLIPVSRRAQKVVHRVGGRLVTLADCPFRIAVDGQLKEWGFAVNGIPTSEIHGIEIYPGPATIPTEFASTWQDSHCGLVMIWTRRDR